MMTVLPTPAPPKTPTLPPLANGAIRSITLSPVSNTSVAVVCSSKDGACAVDRIVLVGLDRALLVDRLAEHIEHASERGRADRHADRATGVDALPFRAPGRRSSSSPPCAPSCCPGAAAPRTPAGRPRAVISTALKMAGSSPCGNSMSTTGPGDGDHVRPGLVCWVRLQPWSVRTSSGAQNAVGACGDLDHLAGDVRLANLVVGKGQVLDQLLRRSRSRSSSPPSGPSRSSR